MATPGHAFAPDTPWQRELEDAFPYVETPDQLAAIDEVKADMEKPLPMDRIICGDVGYGKTEVAVRAAFKAVQDGKQVAVLVPTTLLSHQHTGTFAERMSQFPVTIRELSRFSSDKEADATMTGIADGTVDIVIGTHRLLQQTVRFKNLGLVIIDEEQRFGVEHKEYLKSLRAAVDVLTLSATPIPRTLEMSLTGIREMTTILTPPEERHPILTFVGAYDERQIAAAIHRELLRDGQIFYIHNRVSSIGRTAAHLAELVPEARIAIGHGQMGEAELEQVMIGFWEKRFDVLVCTTIVESGLDIPNANTLIVERADTFGLSQLHQLRGRVGRSRERGYAYFLYPPEAPLTETAYDRLATIAAHTELGGGMAVAMKDLEIRGSGNLLGGEQSGHIAGVGFDLYVRLVGEAVADFRGDTPEELGEVKVDLPGRRQPAPGLPARGAAAVGGLPRAGRGQYRRRGRRRPSRADRPLRPGPAAGGEPAGRGQVPGAVPPLRSHRHLPAGAVGAVLARGAAGIRARPAHPAVSEEPVQVDGVDHGRAPSQGRGQARRVVRAGGVRGRAAARHRRC